MAAGGGDGGGAGEHGERGVGAEAAGVGPGAEHGGGDDRADAGLVEQVGPPGPHDGPDGASRASAASSAQGAGSGGPARAARWRSVVVSMSQRGVGSAARRRCVIMAGGSGRGTGPGRLGGGDDQADSCRWASVAASTAERRAASSTDSAWRVRRRSRGCRAWCGPGLRGRRGSASSGSDLAPLRRAGPLGPVQLDDHLVAARRGAGQAGAVAAGALDRPRPQPARARRRARTSCGIAVGVGRHGDLVEHAAGAASTTAAVWVCMWVSTPMTTSTTSVDLPAWSCVLSLPGADVVPVRGGDRQDCDGTRRRATPAVKLLIRPALPGRAGPAAASGQVGRRHQASQDTGHTRDNRITAQHRSGCKAILTVTKPGILMVSGPPSRGRVSVGHP